MGVATTRSMLRSLSFAVVALVCACSLPKPASGVQHVERLGVCLDVPSAEYSVEERAAVDFFVVELARATTGRAVATVYIGYAPDIDAGLIAEIEQERAGAASRSPFEIDAENAHPGVQYLGVSSDPELAYFHVMFADVGADDQTSVLSAITFCPEHSP